MSIISIWILVYGHLGAIPQEIPYRSAESFEVEVALDFKTRLSDETHYDARMDKMKSGTFAFLELKLKLIEKLNGEHRVKVVDNNGRIAYAKKVSAGDVIAIQAGFTDEIKLKRRPNRYEATFYDAKKSPLSRIVIEINESGDYLLNGVHRGKF